VKVVRQRSTSKELEVKYMNQSSKKRLIKDIFVFANNDARGSASGFLMEFFRPSQTTFAYFGDG